jgi:hypothetical protein
VPLPRTTSERRARENPDTLNTKKIALRAISVFQVLSTFAHGNNI